MILQDSSNYSEKKTRNLRVSDAKIPMETILIQTIGSLKAAVSGLVIKKKKRMMLEASERNEHLLRLRTRSFRRMMLAVR